MVLTGGRVVNTATNLVTSHNLEAGEGAVQKLEKKTKWHKFFFLWELDRKRKRKQNGTKKILWELDRMEGGGGGCGCVLLSVPVDFFQLFSWS